MTKRALLVGLMALAMLFGMLPQTALAQEPVELVYTQWGGPDELEVFEYLVGVFNERNPDIRSVFQPIPTDYDTALQTMIAGGTPPDIAMVSDGLFNSLVPTGVLVSLQPFVDASEVDWDNIWPSAIGRYRWDAEAKAFGQGDIYALPRDIGPTVLYINVDLFEAAGVELPDPVVPMTWDQIIDIGTRITVDGAGRHPDEEGFDPTTVEIWGVGDLWYENTVYGNGGRVLSEDGRTFLAPTDQNTIDAIQFLADLRHVYQVRPSTAQIASMSESQMFETGRVAMQTCGRWCVTNYRRVLDFEWDVRPNPVGPSGQITSFNNQEDCTFSGWSGSVGLAIIKGSKGEQYAEQAYRFIEFIFGEEGQIEQAKLGFQIPNQIDVAQTDVFRQPGLPPANVEPYYEAARCQLPGPWTQTPVFGQWFDDLFWNNVWPAVVVDGTMLAEDALQENAAAFQQGLDEAWATLDN